jgi:NADPH:quinone reductase-like Zn-dependent oxidoreductase
MRAGVFAEHGGPEVIRIEELPDPIPGPGEVRLRVRAAALNHLDLWARRGLAGPIRFPHVGGADFAGEVESLGPGVSGVPVGIRVVADPSLHWAPFVAPPRGKDLESPRFEVIGEHRPGGFAEYVVVPAENLLQLPDDVTFESAAASALVFTTAWGALIRQGGLLPGERVLVTGASGGVSTAAIQLARRAGATVFAVTSGEENARRVRELGAGVVIDRLEGDFGALLKEATAPEGIDLALDSVGAPLWGGLVRCLRPGGRLVTYGATAGPKVETDLRPVFWKRLSIIGSTMAGPADFAAVMRLVFSGQLSPVIDRVLPLEELATGHRLLEEGRVFGKVVFRV